jgi:hypothetical protein
MFGKKKEALLGIEYAQYFDNNEKPREHMQRNPRN